MTTISTTPQVYTLVNVFLVDKDKQVELYDHLVEATERLIKDLPGFISANIHLSHDGQHVVNYAQWQSEEHFRAMHSDPRLRDHFILCRSMSTPKSIPCDVSYVCE